MQVRARALARPAQDPEFSPQYKKQRKQDKEGQEGEREEEEEKEGKEAEGADARIKTRPPHKPGIFQNTYSTAVAYPSAPLTLGSQQVQPHSTVRLRRC